MRNRSAQFKRVCQNPRPFARTTLDSLALCQSLTPSGSASSRLLDPPSHKRRSLYQESTSSDKRDSSLEETLTCDSRLPIAKYGAQRVICIFGNMRRDSHERNGPYTPEQRRHVSPECRHAPREEARERSTQVRAEAYGVSVGKVNTDTNGVFRHCKGHVVSVLCCNFWEVGRRILVSRQNPCFEAESLSRGRILVSRQPTCNAQSEGWQWSC